MTRELIIGSTLGSLGLVYLVFGVQAYVNPEQPLLPAFSSPTLTLSVMVVGIILCMLEARILWPALKALSQRNNPDD